MRLGQVATRAGAVLTRERQFAAARSHYRAALGLGYKLVGERQTLAELSGGLGLMVMASSGLAQLAMEEGDLAPLAELEAYVATLREIDNARVRPVAAAVNTIDPRRIREHAGDLFVFARSSEERVWRVEATLALGRLRFNQPTAGDRRGATTLLSRLVNDPDPAVALAAREALDLTIEAYRRLGG